MLLAAAISLNGGAASAADLNEGAARTKHVVQCNHVLGLEGHYKLKGDVHCRFGDTATVQAGATATVQAGATAFTESIAYTFVTVDISVPDRPGSISFPEDINNQGVIVTNIFSSSAGAEALIADPVKRKSTEFTTTTFNCAGLPFADTSAFSINNKTAVTGYCVTEPNGAKISGFIRGRKGNHILLDFPGADHTLAFGISNEGQIVGQYYNPLELNQSGLFRIHGFKWDKGHGGQFATIDFPLADTYTTLWGVNKRGQILGEYYRFDPATNETLEHNWFVYDTGQFTLDFPPSLEWKGGPAVLLADINDKGQIIGMRYDGGAGWDGLFLFDDGQFFDIALPPEFVYADVRGMNNKGQFVGLYTIQVGIDPDSGLPLYENHGYIATPAHTRDPHSR
jgi:uncharacterized membrane protein